MGERQPSGPCPRYVINSPASLGNTVRGRRTERGWTQAHLAERAGVSRWWLIQLEAGRHRAEFGLVLRVLEAVGLALQAIPDERLPRATGEIDLDTLLEDYRADE